ncbi:hypothetical protein NDU88_004004 [Pleurodeles waltl]|uniref:Uncharacterized protein n=1 Tax=Pleurodeles waltl TaxID=8319 RepID=A0AAV7W7R6_PLEWA|nr:hypothetical protein NDU88_004004 [Pleurodeles waltl]
MAPKNPRSSRTTPEGPRGNKQSAQFVDTGSGTGIKGIAHQGDGLTIPDMFKNPQPTMHPSPSFGKMTMSANLMQVQEAAEREDRNGGLAPLVRSNSSYQDTVDHNECCLDMTVASMDLILTGDVSPLPAPI